MEKDDVEDLDDVEEEEDEEDMDEEADEEEEDEEEEEEEADEEEEEEEDDEKEDMIPEEEEEADVLDVIETKEDVEEDDTNFVMAEEEKYGSRKKKRVVIQRYCKSAKELVHRKPLTAFPITPDLVQSVLVNYTTERNASQFTPLCALKRNDLYQLCGKFIKKEFSYTELYQEMKQGVSIWDSKTFQTEHDLESRDLSIMTIKLEVTEGLYQCGRCKSKKTYSRQVQTRSADEGMTSIIQCSECNKVWREYS